MIRWTYYPNSTKLPAHLEKVVDVFRSKEDGITSDTNTLPSNAVLSCVSDGLEAVGYSVEKSKAKKDLIRVPILYGENGVETLAFEVDAYNHTERTVIEVEAGRGFTNYQFLKDFFECCMMQDVDYFCVAVRKVYRKHQDYACICGFFSALFASGRMSLPLKGILVIGY